MSQHKCLQPLPLFGGCWAPTLLTPPFSLTHPHMLPALPCIRFVKGSIEQLSAAGIAPGSVDLVISNCVVNLCPDKPAVLAEAYKALADGGEFYFSGVHQ